MKKVQSKRRVHCKVTVRSKKGKKEGFLTGRVGAMKSTSLMAAVILCLPTHSTHPHLRRDIAP